MDDVEVEYNVDPLELALLMLIKQSITKPEEMAEYLNVDLDSVVRALEELKEKGLIKEEEEKVFFFKKKTLKLTRKGYNTLMKALKELKPQLLEVKKILEEKGEKEALETMEIMGIGILAPFLLPLLIGGLLTPFLLDLGHDHGLGGHDPHIPPGEPF